MFLLSFHPCMEIPSQKIGLPDHISKFHNKISPANSFDILGIVLAFPSLDPSLENSNSLRGLRQLEVPSLDVASNHRQKDLESVNEVDHL